MKKEYVLLKEALAKAKASTTIYLIWYYSLPKSDKEILAKFGVEGGTSTHDESSTT